jgi:RNA polymerase sigma-70 factor (ECF subfamily)
MSAFACRERMVKTPDEELAARCRAGDTGAFAEVYARCERPVFRYAYHLLGCRDEADDAKQETFMRAWQSIRSFKGDCALPVWLLSICTNVCRDRIKSQRRKPVTQMDDRVAERCGGTAEDPLKQAERNHEHAAVHAAIRGLPTGHREIIVLRELEGLSYQDVATTLGCSVPSVKVRLFRARRLLKQRLCSLLEDRL